MQDLKRHRLRPSSSPCPMAALGRRMALILTLLLLGVSAPVSAETVTLLAKGQGVPTAGTVAGSRPPIVLTFGDARVLVHDEGLVVPGVCLASRVPLSSLRLVQDRRPMAERQGYATLHAHAGFHLASVKDPEALAAADQVTLLPITGSRSVTEIPPPTAQAPDPVIQAVLAGLDPEAYAAYMALLSVDLPTRYSCAEEARTARDLIMQHFETLGLRSDTMLFENLCRSACRNLEGWNVIGVKPGLTRPEEFYLVGAHYDSVSRRPCRLAPGANDNASGMAGVMELARLFSLLETEASLVFVAFGGEEQDFLGSDRYVQELVRTGTDADLKGFVILDMISFFKNTRGILVEGSRANPQQEEAVKRLAGYAQTYTDLLVETTTLYGGSDHVPFLRKGMPGALLIETDWAEYPYYHTVGDRMALQDTLYGVEVLKVAGALLTEAGILTAP